MDSHERFLTRHRNSLLAPSQIRTDHMDSHMEHGENGNYQTPFTTCNVIVEIIIRVVLVGFLAISQFYITPFPRKIQRNEWEMYLNPYKEDTTR